MRTMLTYMSLMLMDHFAVPCDLMRHRNRVFADPLYHVHRRPSIPPGIWSHFQKLDGW